MRWVDTALEVMVEHTDLSRPSQTMVIKRTNAGSSPGRGRCCSAAVPGDRISGAGGVGTAPSDVSVEHQTEPRHRRSPQKVYGKLRPTRPGEYLLMDTTRLDVFALDPLTLRWVHAELTVGMDWYTRCVTGLRVTPVSTKSIDAATVLYQTFRPRPPGQDWPKEAVWPEHGIPRAVLIDVDTIDGFCRRRGASGDRARHPGGRSRQDLCVRASDECV